MGGEETGDDVTSLVLERSQAMPGKKKITYWLHLVTDHHALLAHNSIFWSYLADFMVTANVIFFHLSSEMKVKL